jgi:PAS domain S-box-containing protein
MPIGDHSFRTLLEAAPDAMVIVGEDGRIELVNTHAETLFGYPRQEMVGQPVEMLVPPRYRSGHERHRRGYAAAPATRPMGAGLDLYGRRKDGTEFPVEISLSPLETAHGPMTVSAIRDVTDRMQAERDRARLIEERAAHAEASRIKDEFIATLSHELRTPLNAVVGWTTLLVEDSLGPAAARQALVTILRNARAQARLVEDLLDVSRVISAKMRLHLQPLDFVQVVEHAVDVVRPSAAAKGLGLEQVAESRPLPMVGDADRLQQAVWNLLANAVKFSARGGQVTVTTGRGDEGIHCTVRDTGRGIDPRFLPYVFDRFRQADSSSTREHGGLGLGLSLVRSIVELHGGTVVASSGGDGNGAAFRIVLPVSVAVDVEGLPVPGPTRGAGGSLQRLDGVRVLVVDDEEDERELLTAILTLRGARVATAESAEDAVRALQAAAPDVLVSDMAMAGEDGCALLRRVRTEGGAARHVPAIAVTAHARHEDRERALAAGFRTYLPKPIDPARLVRAVAEEAGVRPGQAGGKGGQTGSG